MKIILKELPSTAPQNTISYLCWKYMREGKKVKTEYKGNSIRIYIDEIFD